MKILLTNDDGYNTKGIRILFKALQKYGEVILIGPAKWQSAKSVALDLGEHELIKHEKNVYSFSGTPADCVSFATRYFAHDWDLVVSGCNDGLNLVYDTCYSGTIGATIEANIQGIKTIAFSADIDSFDLVEKEIDAVLTFIFKNELTSPNYILSVNFPTKEYISSKGYRLTKVGNRKDDLGWVKNSENHYTPYRKVNYFEVYPDDKPIDSTFCKAGYIVFTPLSYCWFSEAGYEQLKRTKVFDK
ncbi:MAG: 5'/3'-nucleotidase SurE [Bacilli bacterium]|nr:5'/3'-nucleotidase SurE [Bacilli bacterium]MDD3422847.1 5'/3'-nucleotidase SurE [Bacilli bacterium]MDD4066227.1 5'/3'-nucleotidase SurE [Bacilli bacterium]